MKFDFAPLRRVVDPLVLASLLAVGACSRHDETSRATLSAARVDASVPARLALGELGRLWNRAMARHDSAMLASLYASTVAFYGVALDRHRVVQVQSDAFAKDPTFTQSILSFSEPTPTRLVIQRDWTRFGRMHGGTTWLEGERRGNAWVIVAEGDPDSDARVAARRAGTREQSPCGDLAKRVALSTRDARALIAHTPGHVVPLLVGTPPQFPGYAIAMTKAGAAGTPTPIAWYDVLPCRYFERSPSRPRSPGVCVPPGSAKGPVTDVFTGRVLAPDLRLVAQLSECPM